jgi:hypothetical protein
MAATLATGTAVASSSAAASAAPSRGRAVTHAVRTHAHARALVGSSAARSRTKALAKVRPGSIWTLQLSGDGCESDSFATHHAFSDAVADSSGDLGTYKGTKKLTMTWTAGTAAGEVFKATWSKTTGIYEGTYSRSDQSVSAVLVPAAAGGCALVTTAPASTSIALGASDSDTATVTGEAGITPTGNVHFYACAGDTDPCTSSTPGVVDMGLDPVTGKSSTATATSGSYTPSATGSYCFLAVYEADGHYSTTSDGSTADECFSVGLTTPEVTTAPTTATITLGASDTDTATVTGTDGITPTGRITFYVCPESGSSVTPCTTAAAANGGADLGATSVSGSAGTATTISASYTPSAVGTYCFLGVYTGDSNYSSASDGSTTDECFAVTSATSPELTTKPSEAEVNQGGADADTATVTGSGGVTPTGSITFYACGPTTSPTACTDANDSEVGSPVTLSGSGNVATAISEPVQAAAQGYYCFLATYAGDSHYSAASDGSTASECFEVGPKGP